VKNATGRRSHLATNTIGERVQSKSPRDSAARGRWGKTEAGGKGAGALQVRSVLVPLDGSQAAEHAIPWALDIAGRAGGDVRFVHVHPVQRASNTHWPMLDAGEFGQRQRKLHQDYLAGVAERTSRISRVPVAPLLVAGSDVAEVIAEAGRSADLVVMATRRRGAMGRLFYGSVVTQLLKRTTLPLLVAPGYNFPVERAITKSIRRILIPLDGSKESETILDAATALSSLASAERTLIRVVPRLPYAGTPWIEKADEALRYLNRVAVTLRRHPAAVRTEIVSSDDAVGEVLLANAQASNIDLIAVTSRSGGGTWKRLVGSPVNCLVGKARMPILVVRATRRTSTRGAPNLTHTLH
jgi:nucleotide-binding universal stress UspA family protein